MHPHIGYIVIFLFNDRLRRHDLVHSIIPHPSRIVTIPDWHPISALSYIFSYSADEAHLHPTPRMLALVSQSGDEGGLWWSREVASKPQCVEVRVPGLSPQLSKKKVDSKIVLQSSVASRTFGAVKDSELFLVFCCTSKIWGCVVRRGLDQRCMMNDILV